MRIQLFFLINQSKEIGEKQFSVFGPRGGQNSPLIHQGFFLQFWEGALGPFRLGKLAR